MTTWEEQAVAILTDQSQRTQSIYQAISELNLQIANERLTMGQTHGE